MQRRQAAGRVGAAPAAARVLGQRGQQPAAHERVDRQRDERVEQDRRDDLAHQQEADRRVDAEQELHQREADRGRPRSRRRRRRAARARPAGRAARAGARPSSRPRRRRSDDSPSVWTSARSTNRPDREAEARARERAAQQADGGDDERREVGVGAEERASARPPRSGRSRSTKPSSARRSDELRVTAITHRPARSRAWSAPGRSRGGAGRRTARTWTCWLSVPGSSTRVTRADRDVAAGTATGACRRATPCPR